LLKHEAVGTPETLAAAHGAQKKQKQEVFFQEIARAGTVAFVTAAASAPKSSRIHGDNLKARQQRSYPLF
jgi:hypothetical protein